jgi:hypothetical protein
VLALAPGAQQPSPETAAVIATLLHATLQPEPTRESVVQALLSSHVVGQLLSGSHVSPGSTISLPHTPLQSVSLVALQPEAQHPSPATQAAIVVNEHRASHVPAEPSSVSVVQLTPSLHVVGHEAPSHTSPDSTTSLPHTGAQSPSFVALAPDGQQRSPLNATVIGRLLHVTLQLSGEPFNTSLVHATPSSQVVGQSPSQTSPASRTPLPHSTAQSESLLALQPPGQQPSPLVHAAIGSWTHTRSQVAAEPVLLSAVQASASAQEPGHAPSHTSPDSRTPLPHSAAQSLSTLSFAPSGQQPSPFAGATIAV